MWALILVTNQLNLKLLKLDLIWERRRTRLHFQLAEKKHSSSRSIHTHTRNWRLHLFSKGTLKLTTNPLEIVKSEQQRMVKRTSVSAQFAVTGSATCLQEYINQVSKRGYNLKMQLIFKTKSQKLVKICEVFLKYRLGISNIHVYSKKGEKTQEYFIFSNE